MRRLLVVCGVVVAALVLPGIAGAHGLGGRSDLPVPLEYFLVGALVVLLVSFGALAVLWPRPRLQDGPRWRGDGFRVPDGLAAVGTGLGLLGLVLVVAAGLFGDTGARSNIAPVTVWVVFWLVLPFVAALFGNFWAVVNPWRTLGRLLHLDGQSGPGPLGVWPAAVAFVAFTWLELVYDRGAEPSTLGAAAVVYTALLLGWAVRHGTDRAMAGADAFTVYHRLLSSLAPFGRDESGRVRWRGWLRALPVLPRWRGLTVFVLAMIGTVTYDGLSATPWWDDLSFALVGTAQSATWFRSLSLVSIIVLVWLGYRSACWSAAHTGGSGAPSTSDIADAFAHTLVPIALAYAFAHYFTLIAFEGQILFAAISDPLGLGWDLFGTVDYRPNFTWISPQAVWWTQLLSILGGHVAAVVLAHDRSLVLFPGERAVRSQYAMLTLMVALTALGLTILAAG